MLKAPNTSSILDNNNEYIMIVENIMPAECICWIKESNNMVGPRPYIQLGSCAI
jgi:hypothetical protein